MSERLYGSISRITFHNEVTGYTIANIELDYTDKTIAKHKSKLFSNKLTVVGILDRKPFENEEYIFQGDFVTDPNYGLQFKFHAFERKNVDTVEGVISYLSSDFFPGIGRKTAKIIVEHLGVQAIQIISTEKQKLYDINELSLRHKDTIYSNVISNIYTQKTIMFLLSHGVTMDMALKIISILGENTIEIIKENPYILMEKVERIGFKKNDTIALNMGISLNSPLRLKSLLLYIIKEASFNLGFTFLDKEQLYKLATKEINTSDFDLTMVLYEEILKRLVLENKIVIDQYQRIYDAMIYQDETSLAKRIVDLMSQKEVMNRMYTKQLIEKAFQKVSKKDSIDYSTKQVEAIKVALSDPITIVTGGPGTGKTTIIHAIIKMYLELNKNNENLTEEIALIAPTGRAAKRLKEASGIQAMTIHKFLGFEGHGVYKHSKEVPTSARLIIVDEASMMDISLASRLFVSMDPLARIVIVGDVDQLPSVGPGQVLLDLINSKEIKVIRLDKIHRQAEDSTIIKLAHSINEGMLPENILEKQQDRNFINTEDEFILEMVIKTIRYAVDKGMDITRDIQVLMPMYKGDIGINEFNRFIQDDVNPLQYGEEEIGHLGRKFRISDKVLQLVNRSDKGVMNGDIGIIHQFIRKESEIKGLVVVFDFGPVEYSLDELEDLNHAYAISVHKAQGSEFDLVIMPITFKHFVMLKKKLIYTAITRAKKSLLLIGNIQALNRGIKYIEDQRQTSLCEKIKSLLEPDQANKIHDALSAFDTLGEIDMENISPYYFLE
jgi:exodeoxyribonuclease V alpha subunit